MRGSGCIEFKVSGHPRGASWLYSLELQRGAGMGESELWMAVGTVELTSQREVMGERKPWGKQHLGDGKSC